MFIADFHVHSNFSDGKLPIPQVVDIYGKRGFGAIAITDHLCETGSFLGKASAYLGCSLTPATLPLYREILHSEAERAWRQYRMVVIPGLELTKNSVLNHRSTHILALGITSGVSANGDAVDIINQIREAGGVSVAAHPVWTRYIEKQTYHLWDRRNELAFHFDAWEVASGPFIFEEVQKSGLPMIASSDFHKPEHMRSWKTVLNCERKAEAILECIRKQQLDFHYYPEAADDHSLRDLAGSLGDLNSAYGDRYLLRA